MPVMMPTMPQEQHEIEKIIKGPHAFNEATGKYVALPGQSTAQYPKVKYPSKHLILYPRNVSFKDYANGAEVQRRKVVEDMQAECLLRDVTEEQIIKESARLVDTTEAETALGEDWFDLPSLRNRDPHECATYDPEEEIRELRRQLAERDAQLQSLSTPADPPIFATVAQSAQQASAQREAELRDRAVSKLDSTTILEARKKGR